MRFMAVDNLVYGDLELSYGLFSDLRSRGLWRNKF